MKKIRLNIAVLATLVAAIFSSCDKDVESTAVTLSLNDTAILTLYVYADLDLTDAGLEAVPAGTELYVKVNYSDYKGGVDGAFIQTIATGENGMATLRVPADDNGITVRVTPLPFNYAQVQVFNSYEETVDKIYTANTVDVNVSAGESKVQQINYNAPEEKNDHTKMTSISGYLTAELNDGTAGDEEVSTSFTITLHTSDWSTQVNVNGGEFSTLVPEGTDIYVTGKFQATNSVGGSNEDYEYELQSSFVGNFTVETTGVVIEFGNGVPVE